MAVESWVVRWFRTHEPTLKHAIVPLLVLSVVLYIRHPATNYIFDEQEALLANPYVNGAKDLGFWDAIYVDFWGLPPNASIGSYRPLPDFIWRITWSLSKHPFYHHLYNLLFHGLNGAMLASFAFAVTRRSLVGWLTGAVFVASAVITEAVSGIVGIADVLGGIGAIAALQALRLPAMYTPVAVFAAVSVGLFSKESALVCVPLLPVAALLLSPHLHPQRPARFARALVVFAAAAAAFILYVELRKSWFPSPLPESLSAPLPEDAGRLRVLYRDLLIWFHQAPLPQDPLNNPLADADLPHRISGALRVYWRGLMQVLLPLRLSGDYSFPQEPIPEDLYAWESVAGGIAMLVPLALAPLLLLYAWIVERRDKRRFIPDLSAHRPFARRKLEIALILTLAGAAGLATEIVMLRQGGPHWARTWPVTTLLVLTGIGACIDGWRAQRRPMYPAPAWPWRHIAPPVAALALVWIVVSYFPHSNIPVVLPTVRAERFWYFPVIGSALGLSMLFSWLADQTRRTRIGGTPLSAIVIGMFLGIQALQAYRHSMDYKNDLAFWYATKVAVPRSAKAHLNYSVMVGARHDLETRLAESKIAIALAPDWPMAHVYTGDTLCRMHRPDDAWPYYERGFAIGPNERSLISLGLQCLYDEGGLLKHDQALRQLAEEHPGSWLAYLAIDTLDNHETHKGVDPEYRPRGYNQGPKEE